MPKKSLIVISLALLTSIPTFAQEADGLTVTLGDIQFEVPGSFEERPDLAVASQLWAPGRFQFREGRAFYHPSSADILQVYSSDNPLVGLNHKKAQKKFLEDFGKDSKGGLQPLSRRTWGLDTFAGMFFPIPAEVSEAHVKMTLPWKDPQRDEEKTQREIMQFMRPDGNPVFPVVLKTNTPAAIYITKLTPAALLQVKGETRFWDVNFAPSQALLGEVTLGTSGGRQQGLPMFRCLPQGPEGARSSSGHQIGREPTKNPEEPQFWRRRSRLVLALRN